MKREIEKERDREKRRKERKNLYQKNAWKIMFTTLNIYCCCRIILI